MGLMILKCPKCGQSNLIKENEYYRCPLCESIVFNDDYKRYEETIERLIQEGKESDIGVLRHSLNIELEQEHLNTENIKALCRQIKAIIPEDVISSFYLSYVDRKAYPRSYESFLKTLCSEDLSKYEQDQIIPVIINSCDIRVKELVEELLRVKELYNEENQRHLRKALQEREEEIERYDTEKDVFICHSSKDKEEIKRIVNAIEDNGLTCWYSGRNLPWDIENYWEGIHKAINDCKAFLFVLSKYSRMSKDVVHEPDYARSINKQIRVEYRIDESENNIPIKRCFDGIQWIDGSKAPKYEELAERIYNSLENEEIEVKPQSNTYEEVNTNKRTENVQNKPTIQNHTEEAMIYTEGLKYKLSTDETSYSVIGIGAATDTEIIIPSIHKGLPVTSIGASAFYECSSLKSVKIPNSIRTIKPFAFVLCSSLTRIEIPNSVTSIGKEAFSECYSLKSVIIGNGVTSIGNGVFHSCRSLTSITIPDSVTSIGERAFVGCISLTSTAIPNSVTEIGKDAFYGCNSLTSVTIGNSMRNICSCAFDGCGSLKDVYYVGTKEQWKKIKIGTYNTYLRKATIHYNYKG